MNFEFFIYQFDCATLYLKSFDDDSRVCVQKPDVIIKLRKFTRNDLLHCECFHLRSGSLMVIPDYYLRNDKTSFLKLLK